MSYHQHQTIDLLEIYHARTLRELLMRQIQRLSYDDTWVPGFDPSRRQDLRDQYAGMLGAAEELLRNLGDDLPYY